MCVGSVDIQETLGRLGLEPGDGEFGSSRRKEVRP